MHLCPFRFRSLHHMLLLTVVVKGYRTMYRYDGSCGSPASFRLVMYADSVLEQFSKSSVTRSSRRASTYLLLASACSKKNGGLNRIDRGVTSSTIFRVTLY